MIYAQSGPSSFVAVESIVSDGQRVKSTYTIFSFNARSVTCSCGFKSAGTKFHWTMAFLGANARYVLLYLLWADLWSSTYGHECQGRITIAQIFGAPMKNEKVNEERALQ